MPKATTPVASASAARQARRHNPLEDDLVATGPLRSKTSSKRKSRHEDEDEDQFVDAKASRTILRIGQELAAEELELEKAQQPKTNSAFDFDSRFEGEEEDDIHQGGEFDDDEAWGDEEEEIVEEVELAPDDLETFSKFFPTTEDPLLRQGWGGKADDEQEQEQGGTNLADLILEKIAAHEATQSRVQQNINGVGPVDEDFELPPKVVEVYSKIGLLLSRYKSGKLPKPFKILPTVPHWEDILEVTQPMNWTPNAVYEATRIWVSGAPNVAQRFNELVLLERVRDDIHETKKLNVHLFNALKKALYKPAAFFKGFLFPLVGSGTCTLREASIVSGVLTRISIPVLHSAAAIKGLCDLASQESSLDNEGGGSCNIFLTTLLKKKYALPYQVIDALVFHFLRFRTPDTTINGMDDSAAPQKEKDHKLPVIWHQCLLAFAQRYRNDITEDQREALLDLLSQRSHTAISPEIRRELLSGRGRGVPLPVEEGMGDGGDDTMMMD